MYLYSKTLEKNVFVAKVITTEDTPGDCSMILVWTEETGWKKCCIRYFEPPREEDEQE